MVTKANDRDAASLGHSGREGRHFWAQLAFKPSPGPKTHSRLYNIVRMAASEAAKAAEALERAANALDSGAELPAEGEYHVSGLCALQDAGHDMHAVSLDQAARASCRASTESPARLPARPPAVLQELPRVQGAECRPAGPRQDAAGLAAGAAAPCRPCPALPALPGCAPAKLAGVGGCIPGLVLALAWPACRHIYSCACKTERRAALHPARRQRQRLWGATLTRQRSEQGGLAWAGRGSCIQ